MTFTFTVWACVGWLAVFHTLTHIGRYYCERIGTYWAAQRRADRVRRAQGVRS